MKKILVHVGMQKTASSTLQKNFFPKSKLVYLNDEMKTNKNLQFLKQDLIKISRGIKPKLDQLNKKYLDQFIKQTPYGVILSHEGCSTLMGGRDGITYREKHEFVKNYLNFYFEKYSLLIFMRKPSEWFRSIYKQRVKRGYYKDYDYFLSSDKKVKKMKIDEKYQDIINLKKMNYFNLYELFKRENQCEELFLKYYEQINLKNYLNDLSFFFEFKDSQSKENISVSDKYIKYYRLINFIYINILNVLSYALTKKIIKVTHQKINRLLYNVFINLPNTKSILIRSKENIDDLNYLDQEYEKKKNNEEN